MTLCQLPSNQSNLEYEKRKESLDVREVLQKDNTNFGQLELKADSGFFTTQDLKDYLSCYHLQHPFFVAVLIVPP